MPWRELAKPWHDTTVEYCDVCGNLLIGKYWEFPANDGSQMRACCQDDERLFALLARRRAVGERHGAER
jgi:hypothetical protein